MKHRPGEQRLKSAVNRILSRSSQPRRDDPQPYDELWGWWIEQRLEAIEKQQKWLIGLAVGALVAQLVRALLGA
jgi:hypothetical protein